MLENLTRPEFWQNYFSSPLPHLGLGMLAQGNRGLTTGLESYMNFALMNQQKQQQQLIDELRKAEIERFRLEKQRFEEAKQKEEKLNEYVKSLVPETIPADPAMAQEAKNVADSIYGTNGPVIGLPQPNPALGLVGMFPYLPDSLKEELLKTFIPVREKPFVAPAGSAVFGLPGQSGPFMVPDRSQTQYKERMLPISSSMQQMQISNDGGQTWTNVGAPRPIYAPPIQVVNMGAPQPIPDPNSPTGYSYAQFPNRPGVPYRNTGAPAPAPPGNKPPGEVGRMNVALEALDQALDAYKQELKRFNPRNPADQIDPAKRARLSSLYGDVMLQMKEAQALGALQAADLEVMGRVLTDPTSTKGAYYGVKGLLEQIDQGKQVIARRRSATEKVYPSSGGVTSDKKTITINGKSYEVLGLTKDGIRIRDPQTGRTGTYRE
jgi:hypothetical protein